MDRKTYVENNDFELALSQYLKHFSVLGSESIPTEESCGRVTAGAVYAVTCDPIYNAAAMDGIAVFADNTSTADEKHPLRLIQGRDFEYVNTGNPIPSNFDSVIMIEDVLVAEDSVSIIAPSRPWQHVRVVGESVVATEMVLPSFRRIRPYDLGAILAGGNDRVCVVKQPRVGIIPTGEEMVESADELKVGKLRESNTRVFAAMTTECGGIPKRYALIPDRMDELEKALLKAVADNDIVVVNAGSSAGTKDFTVHIIEKLGKVYTHGLAIKPGKPTILGEINGKPVIGVPGYPVSAYIVFEKVVKAVISALLGEETSANIRMQAQITKRITSTLKHEEFVRVALGDVNGKLVASPLERGAAAVMSMVKADGIVTVPRNSEGIESGEMVEVELLRPLSDIKKALVIVGSHDMIIDVIGDEIRVSSAHVGSLSGIMAMKNGAANIAPIHLLDEETGVYNEAYVRRYFDAGSMALVRGVGRVQGLLVEKGNPKRIYTVDDLRGGKHSFANRQGGAGTRILFDYLLKQKGINSGDIRGYDKEFITHLAVATAVKNRAFDCGLAIKTAAKVMDLDFIPVGKEHYDFLVRADFLTDERFVKFLDVIRSDKFKRKLDELGGYSYDSIGEITVI